MWIARTGIIAGSNPISKLNTNLVAIYKAENNANDSLGAYNGTAVGGVTYVTGINGNAFNFNGTNAYIQLGDVMDIGTSSWTYSMRFNANVTAGTSNLFTKTYSGIGDGRVRAAIISGKITFAFAVTIPLSIVIETINTISANTWYNVVFVLDRSNNLRIYLNGILQSVTVTSGPNDMISYNNVNYNNTNPFRIGAATASDNVSIANPFNGEIDEFGVWNKVLTQAEIIELQTKYYPF